MLLQSSSTARPAQITTVRPGRVILGTCLRLQVILTAETLKEQNLSESSCFFLKSTDEVNSGKSYYVLLMSVIKSKPITKQEM